MARSLYSGKPASAFWSKSVSRRGREDVDPITSVKFRVSASDKIATGGSCFAQHIARTLQSRGMQYFVTEKSPRSAGAIDENYSVYPARFGNIYTVRQLLQLLQRAYGLFKPTDEHWLDSRGRVLDPFRPRVQADGFSSVADMHEDRVAHLAAVREMFEGCDVFIFTLGLTEGWESTADGAVFPLAPSAVADKLENDSYAFRNFTVSEMQKDFDLFMKLFARINPDVRIIITVSPVALVATYEDRHVLCSNTYSKAALRVVSDYIENRYENVLYFPSYEIITGPNTGYSFFEADLREVRPEGVAHVMSIFCNHFLAESETQSGPASGRKVKKISEAMVENCLEHENALLKLQKVVCEEELLDVFSSEGEG